MHSRVLFFIAIIFLAGSATAQNLTRSPYSGFGVGDLQFYGFGQQQAMGRITQSIRKVDDFSPANPASYGALRYANYQAGLYGTSLTMKQGTQSQRSQTASLGYFSLGVPISRKLGWGGAFGLMPYSSIGYNSATTTNDSIAGQYSNQQIGSGGINRFFMGTGIRLTKRVSIGFNASYLFGQLSTTNKILFQPDSMILDYREDRSRIIGGFNFDFGLQYWDTLKRDLLDTIDPNHWVITTGVTYNLNSNLNATQQLYARSIYHTPDNDFRRDTVVYSEGQKGKLYIPQGITAGIGIGNTSKRNRRFFALEYKWQNWKQYTSYGLSENLMDYQGFSAGMGIQPYVPEFDTDISKRYYRFIHYRAGFRYANTQLYVNNTQISEYGINFGLSLPVKPFKIVSYINLSFEYNNRGTVKNNLIREDYYRVILGFTLNDIWFIKYRYD